MGHGYGDLRDMNGRRKKKEVREESGNKYDDLRTKTEEKEGGERSIT